MTIVRCRLKVSRECYDGTPIQDSVYKTASAYLTDNTYDPDTETIECDPCFLMFERRRGNLTPLQQKIHDLFGPQE